MIRIHTLLIYFFKFHICIILPFMPRLPHNLLFKISSHNAEGKLSYHAKLSRKQLHNLRSFSIPGGRWYREESCCYQTHTRTTHSKNCFTANICTVNYRGKPGSKFHYFIPVKQTITANRNYITHWYVVLPLGGRYVSALQNTQHMWISWQMVTLLHR